MTDDYLSLQELNSPIWIPQNPSLDILVLDAGLECHILMRHPGEMEPGIADANGACRL